MHPETSIAQTLSRASYTIDEAIAITGWNRNRVYVLIAEGKLKTFRHGRRRFVAADAINKCIRDLERDTADAI